jgi:hypothetical protein
MKEKYTLPKCFRKGEICYIPIANQTDMFAIVDAEDYNKVKHFKWYKIRNQIMRVVVTLPKGEPWCLARFITNCPQDRLVGRNSDDILDFRKQNVFIKEGSARSKSSSKKVTESTVEDIELDNYPGKVNKAVYQNLDETSLSFLKEGSELILNEYKSIWERDILNVFDIGGSMYSQIITTEHLRRINYKVKDDSLTPSERFEARFEHLTEFFEYAVVKYTDENLLGNVKGIFVSQITDNQNNNAIKLSIAFL